MSHLYWHGGLCGLAFLVGQMTLSIQAEDPDANGLMDPSVSGSDGRYNDTHHDFTLESSGDSWTVMLSDVVYGSPVLADLDDDGDLDVAIQCANGWVELLDDDGSSFTGWPKISGDWGMINVYASPSVAYLDDNSKIDLLSVNDWGCHAREVDSGLSINEGWPVYMGNAQIPGKYPSHSAPTIGDVDGDGDLEVVICRQISESTTLEPTVYLFEHTGGLHTWCKNLEPTSGGASVITTAAIGDVTDHAGLEIIICTAEGFATFDKDEQRDYNSGVYLLSSTSADIWDTPYNCWFWGSPVVADIDGDGYNEIILGTGNSGTSSKQVLVLDGEYGVEEHSWYVGSMVRNSVGICDLNDDGILDVVATTNGGDVFCWSGESFEFGDQYDPLPGFPVEISGVLSAPSIADIDSDLEVEIVVGSSTGDLYAINPDGSICTGFPIACDDYIYGQPAIGDIDGDGHLELVFAGRLTPTLYCYDLGAGTFPAQMPWRQFQHDSWHTGFFTGNSTIPAPPTNLTGEQRTDGTVDLEWDLSVNDFYSPTPEEPTDVLFYEVWRHFPGFTDLRVIGRTHAGDGAYTDVYIPLMYPVVRYMVTAHDGTNTSEFSNDVRFHTRANDVISLGCSVSEEFCSAETSQRLYRETARIESDPGISGESAGLTSYTGNPGSLTDGQTNEVYRPSSDASAVVIDLGEECSVSAIIPDGAARTSSDESVHIVDEYLTLSAWTVEVAGDNEEYEPFDAGRYEGLQGVRYIRITGAAGMTEISVYGSRPGEETCTAVEISRSSSAESWMILIPESDGSGEAEVRIFDLAGRIVWDSHAIPGTTLHWDGRTGDGNAAPNGVYLVQCSIGEEITTGRLVVRQD